MNQPPQPTPRPSVSRRGGSAALALVAALWSWGCAADAPSAEPPPVGYVPVDVGRDCPSPAPEWHCMLPFPSNFHRAEVDGAPRVVLPARGVPTTTDGERVDLLAQRPVGGASLLPQIAALIPTPFDPASLVFHDQDLSRSRAASTSPTLIIDAQTGETVAHFAEVDPRPESPEHRALMLRLTQPLRWGRRYVVVIHGLRDAKGVALVPSPHFQKLLSGGLATEVGRAQSAYYDAHVLPVVDAAGVARDQLVLAWDFTTAERASVLGTVASMAEAARAAAQKPETLPGVGAFTLHNKAENPAPDVAWRLDGEVALPAFVDSPTFPSRHVSTTPTGTFAVPVRVLVSKAAAETLQSGGAPPVLLAGHGFFGDRGEADGSSYRAVSQRAAAVVVALDWWGLSKPDVGPVVQGILGTIGPIVHLRDRLEQGVVNVAAVAALTRALASSPADQGQFGALTLPGTQVRLFQASAPRVYFGCSLGHILGATSVALAPDIDRAAIQVGGAGLGLIMSRSLPFGSLQAMLDGRFAHRGDGLLAIVQLAELLAPIDPVSWAPETATRPVLMHAGHGDASVPLLSARLHARALELPLLTPAVEPVWGLSAAPVEGASRGYVEVDFGVADPAVVARSPSKETPVHNDVRRTKALVEQIGAFLATGTVTATCDGPCDPQ